MNFRLCQNIQNTYIAYPLPSIYQTTQSHSSFCAQSTCRAGFPWAALPQVSMWLSSQAVPAYLKKPSPNLRPAWDGGGGTQHPTCPVLLVTAAPLVPAEDARVVQSQESRVVDAHLPQCGQPLVQLIHTLWEQRLRGQPSSSLSHLPSPLRHST